ncbi:hypothetical protein QAD02_009039 [Eretmocerus hayati]|uniref:Uncharacterized protein n=1 Tax=Eretmocerus hayati TaxID=131215 RepID=A0ACC2NAM0_9HYME|nr:hypothetical protein QAD02_009039 [Eretmocerus hayati]
MQPPSRGPRGADSSSASGPLQQTQQQQQNQQLRPFTPPDLSSIPHMDEATILQLGERSLHSGTDDERPNISTTAATVDSNPTTAAGPYILGSKIDLGDIDNVDSIRLRLGGPGNRGSIGSRRSSTSRRVQRLSQHFELHDQSPGSEMPGKLFLLSFCECLLFIDKLKCLLWL